jgi:hypothetical protein
MVDGIFDTPRQQNVAIFSGIGITPPPGTQALSAPTSIPYA